MQLLNLTKRRITLLTTGLLIGSATWAAVGPGLPNLFIGKDNNNKANPFVQPQDPALAGGDRDQSLKFGDILFGTSAADVLLGRLGVDVLVGAGGNDVLVGGTEHFNPENRDRAFGGAGNDAFLWNPGDGSDFFDGGAGLDAVVLGLIGELGDDGNISFGVNTDQLAGDVYINPATGLPLIDITNSPGFCEVVDDSSSADSAAELDELGIDRLVRFIIRGVANSFEANEQSDDNGLRVSLHLKDVEFLLCASRDGGVIEAFDLRTSPPTQIRPESVPLPFLGAVVQ